MLSPKMLSKECLRNILQKHRNHTEDLKTNNNKIQNLFFVAYFPYPLLDLPVLVCLGRKSLVVSRHFCSAKLSRSGSEAESPELQPKDLVAGSDHGRCGVFLFKWLKYVDVFLFCFVFFLLGIC